MNVPAAAASVVALLLALGCTEKDGNEGSSAGGSLTPTEMNAKKEVGEAVDAMKALAREKAAAFRTTMKTRLAVLDAKIEELKSRANEAADSGKAEVKEQMEKLAEKREALQKKLDELGDSTEEAWKEMSSGLEAAYEDLEKSVREAGRHFDAERAGAAETGKS